MSANVGFRDAFKLQFMRRLGSWSSRLSSDDVDKMLLWAMRVIPNRDIRDAADQLHTALNSNGMAAEMVHRFFELAQPVRR